MFYIALFHSSLNCPYTEYRVPTTEMAAPHIPVNVESVQCDGSEQNITLCEHRIVSGVFSHDKNVFIVCRPNNIRYSGGHQLYKG